MANVSQVARYQYKDINTGFAVNGADLVLTGDQAVINDMLNLIRTPVGSVYFAPTYGSNFTDMLFDNVTNAVYKAFITLGDDFKKWIPAVMLYEEDSYIEMLNPQSLYVRLVFSINGASPTTLGMNVYAD